MIFGARICMSILIINAVGETAIVVGVLLFAMAVSARRTKDNSFFSSQTTTEIKGLAILMVVFSHIGYFLVSDHHFLVPLSNYAGLGVDLFLILSGYGLTVAALRRPVSVGKFYLKRLLRVCLPVAVTVLLFVGLDWLFLHRTYPAKTIVENLLGFFPNADIFGDLNSPLWYITLLLAYNFLFPIVFWRRFPALSVLAMAGIGWWTIGHIPQLDIFSEVVLKLYKLHFLAFPLGVAIGALINQPPAFIVRIAQWLRVVLTKYKLLTILRWALLVLAGGVFIYIFYHPSIGESWKKEVATSLFAALAILALFLFKKINFKLLTLFGVFSFEIYLLHWPLLYRYNFLYGKIPAGAATLIYLALLLGAGYLYQRIIKKFIRQQ